MSAMHRRPLSNWGRYWTTEIRIGRSAGIIVAPFEIRVGGQRLIYLLSYKKGARSEKNAATYTRAAGCLLTARCVCVRLSASVARMFLIPAQGGAYDCTYTRLPQRRCLSRK